MLFTDDLNIKVEIKENPERIISLVPSITEYLFDLGLSEQIVGLTNYCIHPEKAVSNKEKVGGTKDFSLEKIRKLKPDLIIAVKEENNKELVQEIAKEFPLAVFDVVNLKSAIRTMKNIGILLKKEEKSKAIISEIQRQKILLQSNNIKTKSACYLIWNKPMMTVNENTFISEMMQYSGYKNVFRNKEESYGVITEKEILEKKPQYILLSTEPFSFTEKHRIAYQKKFSDSKVILVDGEFYSWYGSRILKAFDYFLQRFDKNE